MKGDWELPCIIVCSMYGSFHLEELVAAGDRLCLFKRMMAESSDSARAAASCKGMFEVGILHGAAVFVGSCLTGSRSGVHSVGDWLPLCKLHYHLWDVLVSQVPDLLLYHLLHFFHQPQEKKDSLSIEGLVAVGGG